MATTPLTKLLYPLSYQQKLDKWRRGEIDWDGNPLTSTDDSSHRESPENLQQMRQIRRLLVYLRLDSLPSLFTFISLLGGPDGSSDKALSAPASAPADDAAGEETTAAAAAQPPLQRPLEVHGLRMLELTERTSSVMQVTEADEYAQRDPVVNTFRTFSQLNNVAVSGHVAVVPTDSYAETLTGRSADVSADFALIPWSEYGSLAEDHQSLAVAATLGSAHDRLTARAHLEFVQGALASSPCATGVFINNGLFGGGGGGGGSGARRAPLSRTISAMSVRSAGRDPAVLPVADKSHHVFLPFFGGPDDRAALRFVVQLARHRSVSATIAHFNLADDDAEVAAGPEPKAADSSARDVALLATLQSSLPSDLLGRVTFTEIPVDAASAVPEALALARQLVGKAPKNAGDIVVVGRRHGRFGDAPMGESGGGGGGGGVGSSSGSSGGGLYEFRRVVGLVADQVVATGVKASLLVVQAGRREPEV